MSAILFLYWVFLFSNHLPLFVHWQWPWLPKYQSVSRPAESFRPLLHKFSLLLSGSFHSDFIDHIFAAHVDQFFGYLDVFRIDGVRQCAVALVVVTVGSAPFAKDSA